MATGRLFRRVLLGLGVMALVALGGPVSAQDGGIEVPEYPDTDGDGVPDAPTGEPGDLDLVPGDGVYGQFADTVGETTDVADFGSGSQLTGECMGMAWSYDPDGEMIDAAADFDDAAPPIDLLDGGQAFTAGNPFQVHADGKVIYRGDVTLADGAGPENHEWYIRTQGISLDKGGDDNPTSKNKAAGEVNLGEDLPVKFTGLFRIESKFESDNGALCVGKGFFELTGPFPLFTALGAAATVLLAGGIMGLLFNSRPAFTWRG